MKHNFNSGPSILPPIVLAEASAAIHNFNNTGLSILEIGHRTTWFQEVIAEVQTTVKQLMQLGDDYEVLLLHGGATTQFMQVPMNLLDTNATAAYCDNGIWGNKAIKEAKVWGNVTVVASSADKHHSYIQKQFTIPNNASYLHYTSNNTVEGTQWHEPPTGQATLIADMSSDIFCRPWQFDQHGLIYAGAQKNIGAAGVTLVVIKKSILGNLHRSIPAIMDYRNHIEAGSLLNTPPVFAVYVMLLTLRWIVAEGGLAVMEQRAKERAAYLYQLLDELSIFTPTVVTEDRSLMNAVFTLPNASLETTFLELCKQHGMIGIKGHRSVGGLRVSMYNAMPMQSVQALGDLMIAFNKSHQ